MPGVTYPPAPQFTPFIIDSKCKKTKLLLLRFLKTFSHLKKKSHEQISQKLGEHSTELQPFYTEQRGKNRLWIAVKRVVQYKSWKYTDVKNNIKMISCVPIKVTITPLSILSCWPPPPPPPPPPLPQACVSCLCPSWPRLWRKWRRPSAATVKSWSRLWPCETNWTMKRRYFDLNQIFNTFLHKPQPGNNINCIWSLVKAKNQSENH